MAPRWFTIVAKFGDHLPFYRQTEIFKRQGIDLDRGTLGNWVGRAFRGLTPPNWGDGPPQLHLMPVINHIRAHLRRADRIFVDETHAPVLDSGRKATKSGYFWAVVADDRGHDETTVGRELKKLGYVKLTARPRHHAQDTDALEAFKKGVSQPNWKKSAPASRKALR